MADLFKAVLFYEGPQARGWSEVYYPFTTTLTDAQTLMDGLIPARLAMLDSATNLLFARVSNEDSTRDSALSTLTLPLSGTYVNSGPPNFAMPSEVAVLANIQSDPTHKGHMFVRGLTSDSVAGNAFLAPIGWIGAANGWAAKLIAGFAVQTHRGGPPVQSRITNISIGRLTKRNVGRPFGLQVGRRKIR